MNGEIKLNHRSMARMISRSKSKKKYVGQPITSGVKEGEISLRPQKGHKRVDTNNAGVKSCWFFNNTCENLLKGMEFRPEHFIIDVSGKYPRLWALKGAGPNDVRRWYNFGALTSICTIAPGFREISELPDWVLNAVRPLHEEKEGHLPHSPQITEPRRKRSHIPHSPQITGKERRNELGLNYKRGAGVSFEGSEIEKHPHLSSSPL
ncbi:hypothetical protein ACS0TY_031767 [Phlomoides rotata]